MHGPKNKIVKAVLQNNRYLLSQSHNPNKTGRKNTEYWSVKTDGTCVNRWAVSRDDSV